MTSAVDIRILIIVLQYLSALLLFVFEYASNLSGFQLMASWNVDTEWTIQGLFMNHFVPNRYRGVTGVTLVMGELIRGWCVRGGINNENTGNGRP